jgi:hypothetical protein
MRQSYVHTLIFAACLFLMAPTADVNAQARKSAEKKGRLSPVQQSALDLADGAADELRQVEDLTTRVELTEEVVELLKARRPARCRQILDAIFAEALEGPAPAPHEAGSRQTRHTIIQRVIKAAAAFDRALALTYVSRYEEAERVRMGEQASGDSTQRTTSELNLALATNLVEKDPSLATSVAERSIPAGVTPATLVFLETLRQRDAQAANNFFAATVRAVASGPGRAYNVNDWLLLQAYVFSLPEVPTLLPQGLVSFQIPAYQQVFKKHPVDPALAKLYLQQALLLLANPGRSDAGNAWEAGDLGLLKLIEPYVAAYLPEKLEALRGLEYALAASTNNDQRASLQNGVDRWNEKRLKQESAADAAAAPTAELTLRQIDEMSESPQKDQFCYGAAVAAVNRRSYDDALSIVEKMSPASRDAAKQFITFSIAEMNLKDARYEEAERWAKLDGDPVRRAFTFVRIAKALVKNRGGDAAKVLELLGEVERAGAQMEVNKEKVFVLLGEAAVYSGFDKPRAFDLLARAVEAANRDEGFTGDANVYRDLSIGGFSFSYIMSGDDLTLSKVIGQLGAGDFYQTLGAVQRFRGNVPRLKATLALCRSVVARQAV